MLCNECRKLIDFEEDGGFVGYDDDGTEYAVCIRCKED